MHNPAATRTYRAAIPAPSSARFPELTSCFWSEGLECYLAELYVVPSRRGRGLGRAIMDAAIAAARAEGADTMDLGTSEDDVAARALYERLGFSNREGKPDGALNLYFELEL